MSDYWCDVNINAYEGLNTFTVILVFIETLDSTVRYIKKVHNKKIS